MVKLTVQNRIAKVTVVPSASALVIKALKEPPRDRKKARSPPHKTLGLSGRRAALQRGRCAAAAAAGAAAGLLCETGLVITCQTARWGSWQPPPPLTPLPPNR